MGRPGLETDFRNNSLTGTGSFGMDAAPIPPGREARPGCIIADICTPDEGGHYSLFGRSFSEIRQANMLPVVVAGCRVGLVGSCFGRLLCGRGELWLVWSWRPCCDSCARS